jgi:hypothetical protein
MRRAIVFLALFLLALAPTASHAAPISWAAAVNGNWNDPTKWSPPQVPVAGDQVAITVSGTYTVTLNVNASVDSLVLGGASGTQTLTSSTHTLTLASASRIAANGAFNFSGGSMSGAGLLAVQGTADLRATVIGNPASNDGLILIHGTTTFNGGLTSLTGSTLRIAGDAASGGANASFASSFTNNGVVELTNSSASQPATLTVTSGTLTNASGKTIDVLAGSGGGGRTIAAQIDNQGTINVNVPLTINKVSGVHTNGGTVNVSGGDLTITQSGTTPSFTTTGNLTVSSGRTVFVSAGALNYNGGSIGGSGGTLSMSSVGTLNLGASLSTSGIRLDLASTTINGPGTLTNVAGATTSLRNVTINAPLNQQGVLLVRGACPINGAFTTTPGDTVRITGDGTSGPAALTAATSFTNNGVIELTNVSASQGATLTVTSGTLTNAASGTIGSLAGAGGGLRTIAAQIDNQGTLNVNVPLALNKASGVHTNGGTLNVSGGDLTITQSGTTPSFTTTGNLNVSSGRTVFVTSGAFNYNGGAIGGSGSTLNMSSANTLNLGASLSSSSIRLDLASTTINGPGTLTSAAGVTTSLRNVTINAPLSQQGVLLVRGACPINGAFTTTPGDTVRITGDGTSGGATLTAATSFTNNGVIELTNVSATQGASLAVTSGTLTNAAGKTIDVLAGSGGGLRTIAAQIDNQGTINVNVPLIINKGSAAHTNGGTLNVSGGDLTITQSGTTPSFTTTGNLNVSSGRTVFVTGTFSYNGGAIGGSGSTLNMSSANTLNLGASLSTASIRLDLSSTILNGPGTLTNAAGVTISLRTVTINAPLNQQGTFEAHGACSINGAFTTTPGDTVRIVGDGTSAGATLTAATSFTNNGVIELTNVSTTQPATLTVTSGTLTNASGGTISSLFGAGGGSRTIAAQIDNRGTIAVTSDVTINKASAAHVSSGVIDLSGGNLTLTQSGTGAAATNRGLVTIGSARSLIVTGATFTNASPGTIRGGGTLNISGTAFTNQGSIEPGASPGILAITGVPTLGDSSTINIELGGPAAGTDYDRLTFSSAAPLAGTLHVGLINGFVPTPGQSFLVVTYPSRTGALAQLTGLDIGGGLSLVPQINATGITLLTVGQTWVHEMPTGGDASLARAGHSAVIDAGGNRMIVFGGTAAAGPANDVWVLTHADGTTGAPSWTKLTPSGGPPAARANHTGVYDPATNRMIVYGGDDAANPTPNVFGDVWVLSNANGLGGAPAWTPLSPTGGPPSLRTGHDAVYDAAGNRMIVFGGDSNPPCGAGLNDVWVLSHANGLGGTPTWSQLAPAGGPPSARAHAIASYDAATNRMTVVGGLTPCGAGNNEMWVLADANGIGAPTWTQLSPGGSPPSPWSLQSGVYDPSADRLTVFGGVISGSFTNTVLTLTDGNGDSGTQTWVDLVPTSGPPDARSNHSAVQAGNHRMIVFGGLGASGRLADVWVLEETQGRVVSVPLPPSPPSTPLDRAWSTAFTRAPWPNPSRAQMQFAISVAREQHVQLAIVDVTGRRVVTLFSGSLGRGEHAFKWRGETEGGRAAPGLYFLTFDSDEAHLSRRIAVTR